MDRIASLFRDKRGGSWNNNHRNVRCANRNRNVPDNFNNNIGFRLVSHDSHRLAGKARLFCRDGRGPKYQSQRYLSPVPSPSPFRRGVGGEVPNIAPSLHHLVTRGGSVTLTRGRWW